MSYITASDNPKPQFIVVTVHDEYEQTVRLFITREAAMGQVMYDQSVGKEFYFAELIAVEG